MWDLQGSAQCIQDSLVLWVHDFLEKYLDPPNPARDCKVMQATHGHSSGRNLFWPALWLAPERHHLAYLSVPCLLSTKHAVSSGGTSWGSRGSSDGCVSGGV